MNARVGVGWVCGIALFACGCFVTFHLGLALLSLCTFYSVYIIALSMEFYSLFVCIFNFSNNNKTIFIF